MAGFLDLLERVRKGSVSFPDPWDLSKRARTFQHPFLVCALLVQQSQVETGNSHSRRKWKAGKPMSKWSLTKSSWRGKAGGQGALKVTELRWQRAPKTQTFAENRRFSQIHPFSWKFQHLEGAGNRRKPQIFAGNRRFSQKTGGNRRLGSVILGASPLARP